MKIYLAGPMSGMPDHNFPAFDAARDLIKGLGHSVVSPPDLARKTPMPYGVNGYISPEVKQAYMLLDCVDMLDCDAVVVLPQWMQSSGARCEVLVATQCGIPVYALDQFLTERRRLHVQIETAIISCHNGELPK